VELVLVRHARILSHQVPRPIVVGVGDNDPGASLPAQGRPAYSARNPPRQPAGSGGVRIFARDGAGPSAGFGDRHAPGGSVRALHAVSHTLHREIDADVERLFGVVVAEDVLPRVLRRWGPIPAVAGTRDLTGPWDTPGSERTVLLEDGNTARERVLSWERPRRFEYRVDRFTSPIGRLVDHAVGSWEFAATERGSSFRWTYSFKARGRLAAVLLGMFVRIAWARYMRQCADLCVELAAGP
jgi:hypothetical protein